MIVSNEDFYKSIVTRVNIKQPHFPVSTSDNFFFAGSCFADNLYQSMEKEFLHASAPPFGPMYNPVSIAGNVMLLAEGREIEKSELLLSPTGYAHYAFHTGFSDTDPQTLTESLNKKIEKSKQQLKRSSVLVLTLGTAFVYRLKSTGAVVNNCHKMPASNFSRELLDIDTIDQALEQTVSAAEKVRSHSEAGSPHDDSISAHRLKVIITISPVRHMRDGAEENSLSKSILRCAVDKFIRKSKERWYFPSFEIMMDELRDYRWYKRGLTHPSEEAVNYIIQRFFAAAADNRLIQYRKEVSPFVKGLLHKPKNKESNEHKVFLQKLEDMRQNLCNTYPEIETLRKGSAELRQVLESYSK